MKKEYKVIIGIYIVTLLFAISSIYLHSIKISGPVTHPLGQHFSVLSATDGGIEPKYLVYGFLPYWSLEQAKHFQLDKLTDIAYFALTVGSDGRITKYSDDGADDPGYYFWRNSKKFGNLISAGEDYGIRFAVTIISHEDEVSDAFLDCASCWEVFIQDLYNELDYRRIKNVNLDFEYVETVDGLQHEKYTIFAEFVNKKLDERYGDSFVTVSAFADSLIEDRITDIGPLSEVTDGLFIMAYDFHRPTSDTAGPISPIARASEHERYDIITMLNDYLAHAPPSKLILGVPYYGYNWVVHNAVPYAERVVGNDLVGYSGSQTYADVMETKLEHRPAEQWNESAKAPYFSYTSSETGSLREVYYENVASLSEKYKLVKDLNLAGAGIWALGYDKGYQELWELLDSEFPN